MKIHPFYFSWSKRLLDVVVSLVVLVVLSPLLVGVGLSIWLTAGWPMFFWQKRMGKAGKTFTIYKFRTMKRDAEKLQGKYLKLNEAPAPMFKLRHDPRFVGIGKFLAGCGLDELPQLINILQGEMSLVGPRPLPINEAKKLPQSWRKWREQVRPGIFSEWSVRLTNNVSLQQWQKWEKQTLNQGGVDYELSLISKTFRRLLGKFFNLGS